ncbi:MAG: hypothetical protein LBF89_10870 [Bacteroidales bacterium]|jgi:hypothetical protein|nr:hypothetical protein [Bacteroidales bacterium]
MEKFEPGTFGYDLQFLTRHDSDLIVLKNEDGNAQVALSAKYQGKVFTSTAQGLQGKSLGWINYRAFDNIVAGAHINATGGEDRMWIGPEGGQFSLFFKPGADMVYDNWFTPPAYDIEPWELTSADKNTVRFRKKMSLSNFSGTHFDLTLERRVTLLGQEQTAALLELPPVDVNSVAFETVNTIVNTGSKPWEKATGTVCIWMLDMLTCGDGVTIITPYRAGDEKDLGKIATTDYFGTIPPEWLRITDKALFLKADGKKRAKTGLSPARALPVSGCYDETNKILTIIKYSVHPEAEYINQLWEIQEQPFAGDAVNAYNDGPLDDGSQMGPFLEIESSSPAALLAPAASMTHDHTVFHFTGSESELSKISEKVLHLTIEEIKAVF